MCEKHNHKFVFTSFYTVNFTQFATQYHHLSSSTLTTCTVLQAAVPHGCRKGMGYTWMPREGSNHWAGATQETVAVWLPGSCILCLAETGARASHRSKHPPTFFLTSPDLIWKSKSAPATYLVLFSSPTFALKVEEYLPRVLKILWFSISNVCSWIESREMLTQIIVT